MKITITPALQPGVRHDLQNTLAKVVKGIGRIDGGGTMMDGTKCDIYIYPIDGKTEEDVRERLTGTPLEPPWSEPVKPVSE